jgi:hypothetical protein
MVYSAVCTSRASDWPPECSYFAHAVHMPSSSALAVQLGVPHLRIGACITSLSKPKQPCRIAWWPAMLKWLHLGLIPCIPASGETSMLDSWLAVLPLRSEVTLLRGPSYHSAPGAEISENSNSSKRIDWCIRNHGALHRACSPPMSTWAASCKQLCSELSPHT